jgi:outer membrane protein assembly factor BamB
LLGNVVRDTLLPPLSRSAGAARTEISKEQARIEDLSRRAQALVQRREFDGAFSLYSQILSKAKRAVFASSYLVPAMVETVPAGAMIELDGSGAGATPKWAFLPSDPDSRLRLKAPGFQPLEIRDPVGTILDSRSPRLRIALVPEILWETRQGGGAFALQTASDPAIIPVVGADGVLRGKKPQGDTLWETPLEAGTELACPPRVAGPALLLATREGKVEALALATGKPAWSWRMKEAKKDIGLGPSFRGQVLVLAGGNAVLLNPFTGLVTRRLEVAVKKGQDLPMDGLFLGVAAPFALFLEGNGDLAGTDLRTGKRAFVREGLLQGAQRIIAKEGNLAVLGKDGLLFGLSAEGKKKLWETKLGGEYSFLLSLPGEWVCVGSRSGSLLCVSSRTGLPLWKSSLEGELAALSGEERSGGGLVVVELLREKKNVVGFLAAANGKLEWEVEVSHGEASSVQMLDRAVLVSAPSRGIVAFKRP